MGDMADYYMDQHEAEQAERSAGRYYPDGILIPELHPRYGIPITAVRGGIKYPTPPKERAVTSSRKEKQKALVSAETTIGELEKYVEKLREELERNLPEPSANRYSVQVQYKAKGKKYEFLLLRVPYTGWYSTAAKAEDKYFPNWNAVVDWLESPDIHWHSNLRHLRMDGEEYSFGLGETVSTGNGEPPF